MFCPQCGKPVDDSARFCPYCGSPIPQGKGDVSSNEPSASTSSDSEVCRVTIRRLNQFYVYNPRMRAFLDGAEVCAVKNASTETFEATKGIHTLRITSFFRKKQVQISILEDTELVVGWNRLTGGINVKTSAPISGGLFSSKGQDSPDNQNNTPNHPARGIIIGGVAAVVIIIIVALVMILRGGTASEISTVQNGYLGEYTDMTVEEILDSYYGFLYQSDGEWISGENADVDGVTVVQVEYSSELLGTATLQFTMLDEQCFEITYINDPMEIIEEASDVLAVLNKVYVAAYESQYEQADLSQVEAQLLERLTEVNATSVRYGASGDYEGDRSQLYQLFGGTQLDMSATELLDLYGIVDYVGQSQSEAGTDLSWLEGDYECTESGTGVYKLSLWFDDESPLGSSNEEISFRVYFADSAWDDYVGDFVYSEATIYSGVLDYQGREDYPIFSGAYVDDSGDVNDIYLSYDGELFNFHVEVDTGSYIYDELYEFYGPNL